jgi:hypothetical protein
MRIRKAGYYSPSETEKREWKNILRERCKNLSLSYIETQEIIDIQHGINYFYIIDIIHGKRNKERESSINE